MKTYRRILGLFLFSAFAALPSAGAATSAVETLNDLLHTSKDAQDGYYESAQQVQSADLKNLFLSLSKEREAFVQDLLKQIRKENGIPSDRGTPEGAIYRGWIDVKTALTKNDDHAVLAEVEKAEGVGLNRYEENLKKQDLPADVRSTLANQAEKIRSTKDLIQKLETVTKENGPVKDVIKDSGIKVPAAA